MVNTDLLYDVIKYNKFSLKEIAFILEMPEKDLKMRMRTGVFLSNEIECLLHFLKFPMNPMRVFFDSYNFEKPVKIEWWDYYRTSDKGKDYISRYLHRVNIMGGGAKKIEFLDDN